MLLTPEPAIEHVLKLPLGDSCLHLPQILSNMREILHETYDVKRRRIEEKCPAPSSLAEFKCWKENQKKLNINFHRPSGNSDIHVSLLYCGFGKFIDDMKIIPSERHMLMASKLRSYMSDVYTKRGGGESDRRFAFAQIMSEHSTLKLIHGYGRDGYNSDFSVLCEDGYLSINFEFRNELNGGSGKEPNFENAGYYIKFQKNNRGQAPCYLATFSGCHYMQVFGAVWHNAFVCIDPLMQPVSMLAVPRDPTEGILRLARVLAALEKAHLNLEKDHLNFPFGPYFRHFGVGAVSLKYEKQLNGSKLYVWQADYYSSVSQKSVVVKFVLERYGSDVHRYLASHGLAPNLLHLERLPGSWIVVVMDQGSELILSGNKKNQKLFEATSERILDKLHERNFVHGDLRLPNFILDGDQVKLIDFDWAGEAGSVKYPFLINNTVKWADGVVPGNLILHEHDCFQIKRALDGFC